jgi:uncharacterized spore protein YtfJ
MIETTNEVLSLVSKRDQQLAASMERLFSAAQASAVFSEPVVSGNYTVITACEVSAGGGFGSGMGLGFGSAAREQSGETSQSQPANGTGGGFGAGGGSRGRPVAAIVIGPDGVNVKPILDVTRVALGGIAFAGSIVVMLRRVLKR